MKYIYGPVPSRRLGRSLGVDPIPSKTCNYQCVYCQLGRTTYFTNTRENFFPKNQIISEIKEGIKQNEGKFDYITFVGSGEPTLYKDLRDLIVNAKKFSSKPICIITNGSLLHDKDVIDALLMADVILPSLDAGDEKSFVRINRPHLAIQFKNMIQGLINFKKQFSGKFWIETMVMKGLNDSKEELMKIKEQIEEINPDRIDINIPIRPPTEKWVNIPDKNVLTILNEIFNDFNDIRYPEIGDFCYYSLNFEHELLKIIERHPMRQAQIIDSFSSHCFNKDDIILELKKLESQNKIKKRVYDEKTFWMLNEKF